MKKIWSYLAVGFAFFSSGIIFAVKFLVSEKIVIKGKVKLKQRGKGNLQQTEIKPEINAYTKRQDKKKERDERRAEKLAKK